MKLILSFLLIFTTLMGSFTMAETKTEKTSPIWIDVRSPEEYSGGHYSEAVNIPHTEIKKHIAELTTDKDADIRVYCRSGHRSGIAKKDLEAMGYTHVINEGGYSDVLKKMK
ncbi:phage shock protein E [Alteromonadaceae bacterium 2753L.S.0a.02]|nr:phage shock protein E [Alteromonadaceae bacterium 2753L.S.0a.02]